MAAAASVGASALDDVVAWAGHPGRDAAEAAAGDTCCFDGRGPAFSWVARPANGGESNYYLGNW